MFEKTPLISQIATITNASPIIFANTNVEQDYNLRNSLIIRLKKILQQKKFWNVEYLHL